MTEQNMIPAEKVRELKTKYEYDTSGDPERLLDRLLHDLDDLLPTPPQPTTGLLGRWAKHPEHGDVVCVWDETMEGHITVHYRYKDERTGTLYDQVPLASLTFPEQTIRPEDVPAGEAWLVDVEDSEESHKSIVALKDEHDAWRVCGELMTDFFWGDQEVTLIAPLTPERPVSDLQAKSTERALDRVKAKYDELEWEYKQAQAEITWLKAGNTPRTVTTKAEYEALPDGSVVAQPGELDVYIKNDFGVWDRLNTTASFPSLDLDGITRTVLRYGWGDEQPAWRIEHDPDNLRVGEYVIDCEDYDGTVNHKWEGYWDTHGASLRASCHAPFIVFSSKDVATPEAIAEAKRARDKEMDK